MNTSQPVPISATRPTFAELFTARLVTILREGYGLKDLRADALAGLTVAIYFADVRTGVMRTLSAAGLSGGVIHFMNTTAAALQQIKSNP